MKAIAFKSEVPYCFQYRGTDDKNLVPANDNIHNAANNNSLFTYINSQVIADNKCPRSANDSRLIAVNNNKKYFADANRAGNHNGEDIITVVDANGHSCTCDATYRDVKDKIRRRTLNDKSIIIGAAEKVALPMSFRFG
ncbi:hypothetical protein DPMN_105555 [Dreissena polymorpha]|uniref:Uncharacterized protein n=1 Tax=Dreissena polymorpha TaxID=45954 RepID=A0A9D4QHT8_DREPO|nr:hypothetical protein DPMN_105555 [Dreissena polymorpha]